MLNTEFYLSLVSFLNLIPDSSGKSVACLALEVLNMKGWTNRIYSLNEDITTQNPRSVTLLTYMAKGTLQMWLKLKTMRCNFTLGYPGGPAKSISPHQWNLFWLSSGNRNDGMTKACLIIVGFEDGRKDYEPSKMENLYKLGKISENRISQWLLQLMLKFILIAIRYSWDHLYYSSDLRASLKGAWCSETRFLDGVGPWRVNWCKSSELNVLRTWLEEGSLQCDLEGSVSSPAPPAFSASWHHHMSIFSSSTRLF